MSWWILSYSFGLCIPSDVNVVVTARIGLGALETGTHGLLGAGGHDGPHTLAVAGASSEFIVSDERAYRQAGNPGATLYVNVDVGLGTVSVVRTEFAP